ncbi:SDR family oxidoreductase [Pedobacter cryoconitis]|uniref:SDR family oxidoreductase n=1 Tax=Pedobacter cryoconitis TaxID=188932 RepID=UPI0017F1DAB3|nr:SDR family oxidoreductase [Pedobacter cryoconitis]MBB5645057.1 hypothetical protein [Pedobacter cryoconitis]
MAKILITGAGSGFAREAALRLAEKGNSVIATVEIVAQIAGLKKEAEDRGIDLQVEKLDVTNSDDHIKAWKWDIDVLLNNAGISEGGSAVDIPLDKVRRQFEVNVFGPLALTQGFAKKFIENKKGKIVFLSSVAGLSADPFTGAYAASKHSIEAFAEALNKEVSEFGVQVATINPGPYLTGFNDRMFETWKEWRDDDNHTVFDYSKISFPHEQYDPEAIVDLIVKVLSNEIDNYRNLLPESFADQIKEQQKLVWTKKQNSTTGKRDELVQKAYEIEPGTPVGEEK